MKKTETLKKNYEFKKVLTKGKYYTGEYIEAFCIKNGTKKNKIGIAIGKKYGKAVKRNYLKRIIKEVYRKNENILNGANSVVFLVKKRTNIEKISFYNINNDIIKILKEIGQEEK